MKSKKAFSLVELSIVLIIIGLLTAVFTNATKLMESTKSRQLFQIVNKIKTALNMFHLEHAALPGDMTNAENFWGTYNASSNPDGTKNGNGNGHINDWPISGEKESLRAWQQLYKAGTLNTPYDGVQTNDGDANNDITGGENVPKTPYDNVIIDFIASTNVMQIAGGTPKSAETAELAVFSNKFLYKFDKKYDDGINDQGYIQKGAALSTSIVWVSSLCLDYDNLNDDIYCTIKILPDE